MAETYTLTDPQLDYSRGMVAPDGDNPFGLGIPKMAVPKHLLINSKRLDSRTRQQAIIDDYTTAMDEPKILQNIEENDRIAKEREARLDAVMERLTSDQPPQEDTSVTASLGESLAGLLGLATGDLQAPDKAYGLAQNRGKLAFQNLMRNYQWKRENQGMMVDHIEKDRDYYRGMANMGRQDLRQVRAGRANLQAQLAQGDIDKADKIDLMALGDQFDQIREKRQQDFQVKFEGMRQANEALMQEKRKYDAKEAESIEATLQGLRTLEEDPSTKQSVIDAAVRGLEQRGFRLPPGALDIFKSNAHANWQERQFKNKLMEGDQRIRDRNQKLDETRFGYRWKPSADGQSGEFEPLNPVGSAAPEFSGFDTQRPDFGKGEQDWKALKSKLADVEEVRANIKTAQENEDDAKVAEYKNKERRLTTEIGDARKASLGQGSVEGKMWLYNMYLHMLNEIKNAKPDPTSLGVTQAFGVKDGDKLAIKAAQDAIRQRFKDVTGFQADDPALQQLRKLIEQSRAPSSVTLPPGVSGPVKP